MTPIPKVLLAVLVLVPIALPASANEEPPRTDPVDWLEEAKALATAGDHPGALDAAHRARELNAARPDELRRRFHGAIRQLVQKKLELARLMVEQVTLRRRLDPQDDTLPKLQQDALRGFSEAYALFAYLGRERDAAEAALAKADLHHDLGQAGSAADCLEAAGKAFEAADELLAAAAAWAQAAEARLDSDPAASASAFSRAAELSRGGGDPGRAGELFVREAEVIWDSQGDLRGALTAYGDARRAYKAADDPRAVQGALMMQIIYAATLGEGDDALEALAADLDSEGLVQFARLFGDAVCLKRLGRLEEALLKLERAEQAADALTEVGLDPKLVRSAVLDERGRILVTIPRSADGIRAFREARRLAREAGDQEHAADLWSAECGTLESLGDDAQARACWSDYRAVGLERSLEDSTPAWRSMATRALQDLDVERAEHLFEAGGHDLGVSMAKVGQTALLLDNGEPGAALRILDQLQPEEQRQIPLLSGMVQILSGLAHDMEGRSDQGIALITAGLREVGSASRSGLLTHSQKRFLLDLVAPIRQRLVGALNELGRPYEALEVAEAGRARAFLDSLRQGGGAPDVAEPEDLRRSRENLESELAEIEEARQRAGPAARRRLRARRTEIDGKLDSLRLETLLLRQGDGDLAGLESSADRDAILETVKRTGPVLYYYWINRTTVLISLLLPGEEEVLRRVWTNTPRRWSERIESFSHGIANPLFEESALSDGSTLYRRLVEPFTPRLPPDGPLVIVPHGPLHELPFAALTDEEGVPLGEKYSLSIAPSLSVLEELQSRRRDPDGAERLLALASGRSLDLPLYEVRQVAGLFPAATILDSGSATAGSYRELAPAAEQLFIASRATADPGDQRLTYVEVDRDETHDSRLTAAEIATIPLAADLVTLAACDTARSNPVLSDEHLDLSRAFLLAGSASVLATRWKLPEADRTTRFLEDFYRLYRNGGPDGTGLRKDEALRQAIARSRRRGDPAQIWAAWVLVGDGR